MGRSTTSGACAHNKDLPAATPFDEEIREALPSLTAAQRADAFFGPVIAYLEIATTDQTAERMQTPVPSVPSDPPTSGIPGAAQSMRTMTLLDIAAACFLYDEGLLRRFRMRTRHYHSVRVPVESDDRGLICVPRCLRLPLLKFYHEPGAHSGRGRFLDALSAEYSWPTMATDASKFVGQCHVCLSSKPVHL